MLALALGSALAAQASTITTDLVVYLPFDNDYANLAPTTVTATPVNAPGFGPGKLGTGALTFSSDKGGAFFNYVTLGAPPELNFGGSTDFTVSMWVKFTTWTGDPSFIANKNWNSGDNVGWVLATAGNGGFQWNFKDGTPRKDYDGPGSTLNNGQWHHIAVSFDRDGNAVTYLDGVLAAEQSIGPGVESLDSGLPTNIGQDGTGSYTDNGSVGIADGSADDVGIWRRALTGFELARIYQFGTNGVRLDQIPDPAGPNIVSRLPDVGAVDVRADTAISVTFLDGTLPLDPSTLSLTLNGSAAPFNLNKVGAQTTITHQPAAPLPNASTNRVTVVFGSGPAAKATNSWSFVVALTAQDPGITGHWDFENGDLSATIGTALAYRGGATSPTALETQFGTTTSFGLPDINGVPARVMAVPKMATSAYGYTMTHGARPNGDPAATKVNQWTIIMDILIPNASGQPWFSFMQIDDPISNTTDGELFANFNGGNAGIGIGGSYQGNLTAGAWHRVAFALDMASSTPVISKWIDGVKAADQSRTLPQLNGRHSLFPTLILFGDEDGESQPAYVNSVQIRNYRMSDAALTALGGPSSEGIPFVTGQWDFEANSLAATIGFDLQMLPNTDLFTGYDPVVVNGEPATALRFTYGESDGPLGYVMPTGSLPNAGGSKLNQYTLIMDVMFPSTSTGFRSLFQTETNPPYTDGDLFINGGNGIGISSQYQGAVTPDTWHRLAFTFDLTKRELGKFIDGSNVVTSAVGDSPGTGKYQYLSTSSGIVDGRWSLGRLALLFNDEDGEVAPGYANSIQLRTGVLTPTQIARLGAPAAAGIPVNIPEQPVLGWHFSEFGDFVPVITWNPIFTAQGYFLESATKLGADADWARVDGTSDHDFEEYRFDISKIWFYRLRK
jgi:hypothetical protein